jgi:hypothetical protein
MPPSHHGGGHLYAICTTGGVPSLKRPSNALEEVEFNHWLRLIIMIWSSAGLHVTYAQIRAPAT